MSASKFKYTRLADHFRDRIVSGDLQPGDRLPLGIEMREQFGVSAYTVRCAMMTLKAEGLIVGRPGDGVDVADNAALPSGTPTVSQERQDASPYAQR